MSDDSWYGKAVSWARQNRVASGYPDGTFRPDEPISREQLASVLYNYHRYALGLLSDSGYDLAGFEDGAQVASYALRPMKWAVKSGIIGGTGENSLSPAAPATRAQTAAMLMRFSELTKDEERYYISDEALTSLCASVLGNMSIRNLNGLAAASDKDTGLTFIYKAPSDMDVTLSPAELSADNDEKIRVWGKYADGTPARLTFGEYFEQFVWSADFIESNEIRLNDFADGHEIPGLYDKYPLGLFVDLRAKTAAGDNVFLTLVFEKHGAEWLLSAIVSDGDILPAANVSEAAEDKTEADEQAPDGAQTEDIAEDTPDAAPAEDTAEAATDASPSEDAADEASSEPAPGAADSGAEDGESGDTTGENAQDVQNG
ncbi:MAG: S-layer homology domain-containing protein [Clostridia bacterium]|nr:S-layer homology domain-containing protein [Clostridia bacterium]